MASVDQFSESATRALADRFSRRSLLGGVGRGGIAMSLGGLAGVAALDDTAEAHTVSCPCSGGCGNSVTCYDLTGSNSCPSGTDGCGWWTVCASPCSYRKVWSDCCSTGSGCDGGARCVSGSPSCYHHKTYGCGCCSSSAHIKCRRWYCTGGGSCYTAC